MCGCAPPPFPPVILPILYTATIMPFEIFFVQDSGGTVWIAIEYLLTILFSLDMLLCFNFAYQDQHGHIVDNRCECLHTHLQHHLSFRHDFRNGSRRFRVVTTSSVIMGRCQRLLLLDCPP